MKLRIALSLAVCSLIWTSGCANGLNTFRAQSPTEPASITDPAVEPASHVSSQALTAATPPPVRNFTLGAHDAADQVHEHLTEDVTLSQPAAGYAANGMLVPPAAPGFPDGTCRPGVSLYHPQYGVGLWHNRGGYGACGTGDCQPGCGPHGMCGPGYPNFGLAHPKHHNTYSYQQPKNLVYPAPNAVGGAVVYPYYTHKGPSDFFRKE